MKKLHWLLIILLVFSLAMTTACTVSTEDPETNKVAGALDPQVVPVNPTLLENYEAFFPAQVITVTDGVYVARGYNRDNPTLIEGDDGLIVVDPGESITAGEIVKEAFNAELDNIFDKKPVKAIIYTHSHDCHIHGAAAFADSDTEIIAHEALMSSLYDEWYGQVYPSRVTGGAMMGGLLFQNTPATDNDGWYSGYVLAGTNVIGPPALCLPPSPSKISSRQQLLVSSLI